MTRRDFAKLLLLSGCNTDDIMPCRTQNGKQICTRTDWWRESMGIDWYSGSGGSQPPAFDAEWYLASGAVPASTDYTIYDPLAALDLESSYINLANPGVRNATPVVAPTFSLEDGWTFNGSTQYINTNTFPIALGTLIIWFEDAAGVYITGSSSASPSRLQLIRPISSLQTTWGRGDGFVGVDGAIRGGISGMNGSRGFKNAVTLFLLSAWTGAASNRAMYIGCENQNGSALNFASGKVKRWAWYNFSLSDAQMKAVMAAMFDYKQPADNAVYGDKVLALNPICYYPCNQAIGSVLFDKSGNGAHGELFHVTPGHEGKYGFAFAGTSNAAQGLRTIYAWWAKTGLNMNEFSCSMWVKNINTVARQVRLLNMYSNGGNEYCACEIRGGSNVAVFNKENGVTENTLTLSNTVSGQWHHIVVFNSLTEGKYGIYFDGVRKEEAKTLTGFVDTVPDILFPQCGLDMNGYMQHIAFYDHALTQGEVDQIKS